MGAQGGVDGAVKHHAAHVAGEQVCVGGTQVGAVGVAQVVELAVAA